MIVKTSIGKSFGGAVRYVTDKNHDILDSQYLVDTTSAKAITNDFNAQRKRNPNLGKAVWHTAISFNPQDQVTPGQMADVARDYIKEMGLENSQYFVATHFDTDHQHIHIIANRVDMLGNSVSDSNNFYKQTQWGRNAEKKFGFVQLTDGKNNRKDLIKSIIDQKLGNGWEGIKQALGQKGIETIENKASTGRISGVTFKDQQGVIYKGSQLGKDYSYANITKRVENLSNGLKTDKNKGFTI